MEKPATEAFCRQKRSSKKREKSDWTQCIDNLAASMACVQLDKTKMPLDSCAYCGKGSTINKSTTENVIQTEAIKKFLSKIKSMKRKNSETVEDSKERKRKKYLKMRHSKADKIKEMEETKQLAPVQSTKEKHLGKSESSKGTKSTSCKNGLCQIRQF